MAAVVHEVYDDAERGESPAGTGLHSEPRWERAFAASLDPMVIVDDEQRLVDANPAAGELLGYEPGELVGHVIGDVVAPRHRERITRSWARFILAGGGRGDWLVVTRDGELLEIESSAAANVFEGHHLMVLRDITERKRAEAEAQRRADQHEAVAEIGRSALAGASPDELMQDAAERIAGVLSIELVSVLELQARGGDLVLRAGVGWADGTLGEETIAGTASQGDFVIASPEPVIAEYLPSESRFAVPPLLREHRVVSSASVAIEGGDRPFGVLGAHSRSPRELSPDDVHFLNAIAHLLGAALARERLARLEAQLQQAHRLESVGQLAGGIAHDFNNLLGVIVSYSNFALDSLDPSHQAHRDIGEVAAAAAHGAELARQLLLFSSRQVVQTRVVDPNAIVRATCAMLGRTIGAQIELRSSCDEQAAPVRVGHGQLEQVVMNLAMNARDAMPDGGELLVETEMVELGSGDEPPGTAGLRPGSYVRICVSDTGTGMSEATSDQAFEPFFTTKERGKGTGLGLATVYGIAQAADGRVWIDSKLGRGTAVSVFLPSTGGDAIPEAAPAPAQPPGFGETVLLIDDDELGRRATERILKENGYAVIALSDPEDALSAIEKAESVDVLVTDLIMPRLSGADLAKRVREQMPEVAVVYVSGYAEGAMPTGASISSSDPLIEKPFDASTLLAGVRSALDGESGEASSAA